MAGVGYEMEDHSIFAAGWHLVRRHLSLLGWLFLANLVLGLMASLAPRAMISPVLSSSLESRNLVSMFSLGAYIDLVTRPEVSLAPLMTQSQMFAVLYLVFTIFVSGGIVSCYSEDRRLARGEFLEVSGRFFFRMLRLSVLMLIPAGLLAAALAAVFGISSVVSEHATTPTAGIALLVGGLAIVFLLSLLVRSWFDTARTMIVERDARSVVKSAFAVLPHVLRRTGVVLWAYLRVSVIEVLVLAAAVWLWLRLPHAANAQTFLVLEAMLLFTLFTRLWQRAIAVEFWQRYQPVPVLEESPMATQVREEATAEIASPEPLPEVSAQQKPPTTLDDGHGAV